MQPFGWSQNMLCGRYSEFLVAALSRYVLSASAVLFPDAYA